MSTCRYCAEPIVWGYTDAGKRMPLNAEPDPAGNVAVQLNVSAGPRSDALMCRVISKAVPLRNHEVLYKPHIATCPNRPAPKTKLVTDGNAATVARRRRRYEQTADMLDGLNVGNVTPIRRR